MFYIYKNIKIHYEIIGEGKPVIILHGLGCDSNQMKGCLEPIFKNHKNHKRVYIDLPGMGKSDDLLKYASSDKILEIILSFIENIVSEKFLIIGDSFGGYLARGVLSKLNKKVDGIMLLCPVVIPNEKNRNLPNSKVKFIDENFINELDNKYKNDFLEYGVIVDRKVYDRYVKEIQPGLKISDEDFINLLKENYDFSFDVDNEIHKIKYNKPALFITGRQDNCVGYNDLWNLMGDYKRDSFSVIDMAGHNLQIEQPQIFNALVDSWLYSIENYRI